MGPDTDQPDGGQVSEATEVAVGYTRLSQDGKSLESQREAIEEYCTDRGLELDQVFSDGVNASGFSADRPEYQELLDRLEDDAVEHVVVRDRSRLSRDSKHRLQLFLELDQRGVEIHITEMDEVVDLEDPYALTRESAQADADDAEKRKEAERGARAAERRLEKGLPTGRPPYGLAYSDDKTRWVAGEDFEDALDVLELRDRGSSWRAIESETGVDKMTARRIHERRELYEEVEARETTKSAG